MLALTGADDLVEGARALIERGVGCVAATCGADGATIVDADTVEHVPAFEVDVVDTTGCATLSRPASCAACPWVAIGARPPLLGCAAAGLVAQGLGSDYGNFDLEAADAFAAT